MTPLTHGNRSASSG